MLPKIEDGSDIAALRKAAGLSQAEMANRMALALRAYVKLEQEPESANRRHIMLAEHVSLILAVERGDRNLAPANVAALADAFAKLRRK